MLFLLANKTIHNEARTIFYQLNLFDLLDMPPYSPAVFLQHIGSSNARHIQYLCINFPDFYKEGGCEPGRSAEDSLSTFSTIQRACSDLKTLEFDVYFTKILMHGEVTLAIASRLVKQWYWLITSWDPSPRYRQSYSEHFGWIPLSSRRFKTLVGLLNEVIVYWTLPLRLKAEDDRYDSKLTSMLKWLKWRRRTSQAILGCRRTRILTVWIIGLVGKLATSSG